MNAYLRFRQSLERNGLGGTLRLSVKRLRTIASMIGDHWFDYCYGTDTIEIIELDKLDITSENKRFGMRYEVTRARPLRKLLRVLDLPKSGVLVDFGSGKGRVLMIAAEYGFRKVVGVEFSRQLCDTARKNLVKFQNKLVRDLPVEILEMDVVDYEVRPDENIFFLFNPFDVGIVDTVVGNIAKSLEQDPRRAWLIYQYPEFRSAVDANGSFVETGRYEWGGCEFIVYRNRINPRLPGREEIA
jgi:SAM-dependent methyltransferase